jgi:hypothetical protein
MSTTALFIELLITGLQSTIWLTLLILSFLGFDWINPERLRGFEIMMATILLPIVYPTGVFVDYLADQLFRRWELKIRESFILDKTQTALKLLMQTKDPSLAAHFGYIRSRIRISRSSALNFALITVTSVIFTITWCRDLPRFPFWRVILLEIALGASLAVLAALAWRHINRSFFKWVIRGYDADANISEMETIEEAVLEASLSSSESNKV